MIVLYLHPPYYPLTHTRQQHSFFRTLSLILVFICTNDYSVEFCKGQDASYNVTFQSRWHFTSEFINDFCLGFFVQLTTI